MNTRAKRGDYPPSWNLARGMIWGLAWTSLGLVMGGIGIVASQVPAPIHSVTPPQAPSPSPQAPSPQAPLGQAPSQPSQPSAPERVFGPPQTPDMGEDMPLSPDGVPPSLRHLIVRHVWA